MHDLNFQVEKAEAVTFAASPQLVFKLRVSDANSNSLPIHTIMLRCQIRIEPTRRHYSPSEEQGLQDLFDKPERWGQTLRSMLWTHASCVVPAFTDSTLVDVNVPCSYDFNIAATKYFYALEDGEVPLLLLFSGTVFYATESGALQVMQIPWEKEATFRLPVSVWKQLMEHYYPNSAWLCLQKDVFDRLYKFKQQRGIPTWEQALETLLQSADESVSP